jgi:hypothetical protein
MRAYVVLTAALVFAVLTFTHAQAPTAGPEHKRLAYFAGTWNFTGETAASPMGPAGAVTFKEVCDLMDGGFALVCRSEGKNPMGPSKAVSIMSYDTETKTYTYTAAESNAPVFTALGQVKNQTWTWTTEANAGGKRMSMRVSIEESSSSEYGFRMEMSVDGGAYTQIMQGKASKVTT